MMWLKLHREASSSVRITAEGSSSKSCRKEKGVFKECSVTGGDGANGVDTNVAGYGHDGGWAGRAYGGAVYMTEGSNPTFENCTFQDCFARGGDGGNGAPGDGGLHGGRGGNWEYSPDLETGPFTGPEPADWLWWDGWTFGDVWPEEGELYDGWWWYWWWEWEEWDWEDIIYSSSCGGSRIK